MPPEHLALPGERVSPVVVRLRTRPDLGVRVRRRRHVQRPFLLCSSLTSPHSGISAQKDAQKAIFGVLRLPHNYVARARPRIYLRATRF